MDAGASPRRWAAAIGPSTAKLAALVLESRPHPEQGYRACIGILRLARQYGAERLEAACDRGLDIGARADILELVRGLIASEGLSVLWATHLTDEILETDDVIVLHKGVVRACASARALQERAGADNIKDAFVRLIEERTP